ncbi:hypothetical protein ERO13_A10G119100v2 [Gossypium hirsutum]|nr:hypothetical protein ERO13_A10G119100v2 [Gossypium hirsutum]
MKMAVLLFVLARCGSFITIWKMAKLGFFGIFIVPKLCTSYSHQLSAYGLLWSCKEIVDEDLWTLTIYLLLTILIGIMLLLETARSFEASLISVGVHGTFFSAMFLAKQTKVLILCSSNFKYLSQFANFRILLLGYTICFLKTSQVFLVLDNTVFYLKYHMLSFFIGL